MWLHHRLSKDIDLFFESAAALRLLSPNRNPQTRRITDRWQEPGHYLKFEVAAVGEIDILVTRNWLEPPFVKLTVSGAPMAVQRPAEIIARKIAYRSSAFKMRDFFDLAALAQHDFNQVHELEGLIQTHIDDLKDRWTRLSATLPQTLRREVTPVGDGYIVGQNIPTLIARVFSICQPTDNAAP